MGSSALGPKRRLADVSFSAAVRGEATFRGLLTTSFGRPELALSPSMRFCRRYSHSLGNRGNHDCERSACAASGNRQSERHVPGGQITSTHPGASRGRARRQHRATKGHSITAEGTGPRERAQLTAAWRKSREQRQRRRLGHALGEQLAKEANMARDEHNEAAQHHENAAKAHRSAAEHHGKGDHAKGKEHSNAAMQHSQTAHQHSDKAHSKSQQQK